MKKIKVNADLYVGDDKLATVKEVNEKIVNYMNENPPQVYDDSEIKEEINNLKTTNITSDRIESDSKIDTTIRLTLNTVDNKHIGGTVGRPIQEYPSTRCYVSIPLEYKKIKFYWEGLNGYGNLSYSSGKIIITDGDSIGTSNMLQSIVCSAIATNGNIDEFNDTDNYAILNVAKVKTSFPDATHAFIIFDMGVDKFVDVIAENNKMKNLNWLELTSKNFPDKILTKNMMSNEVLQSIGNKNSYMQNKNKFRIILLSDIHYKAFEGVQGYTSTQRVEIMTQVLNKEYAENGFDFAIFNGDICNNDSSSDDIFKKISDELDSKLTFNHFYLNASHDYYTEDEFKTQFGYSKNYTVRIGNNLFVCIDNYNDSVNTVVNSGFGYTTVDMDWFQNVLDRNTDIDNIFIVCHYLDQSKDSAFITKINDNAKVLCGFEGHVHDAVTVTKDSKNFYRTGHFSVTAGGTWSNDNPWGYRVVESDGNTIETYMVYPEVQYETYKNEYNESEHIIIKNTNDIYTEFVF